MSMFITILSLFTTLRLTPFRVESLITNIPQERVSDYDYAISKNNFAHSLLSLWFVPEVSYSKTKTDDYNPVYNEGISFYLGIFSPSRIHSITEKYFVMKENYVSKRISFHNAYLTAIGLLFDYEYTKQKLLYDSLNIEYAEKIFKLSNERLKLGLSDSLDFLKGLDNLQSIKLTYIKDSSTFYTLKKNIKDYLGIRDEFVVVIDSFVPKNLDDINPQKSENVILSKYMKKSALYGTYISLFSLLPEIGIEYSRNYTGNTFEKNLNNFDNNRTFRVYFTINPLNFLFNLRGSVLRYKKSVWSLKSTIIKEKQQLREQLSNLNFLKNELNVLKNRLKIKERSFNLSIAKYSEGELPFQDVLREQADYMSVISEYLKVKLDIIKLKYTLLYDFGGEK